MGKKKKILIVEDEVEFAEIVQARLQGLGYDVSIAEDAYQGNKAIINEPPDLVILDLSMPVGDGFTLLKRICSDPSIENPEVVILTGQTVDEKLRKQARRYNVAEIFTKPYDRVKFVEKIQSLVPV